MFANIVLKMGVFSCATIAFLLVSTQFRNLSAETTCGDWEPYKDEKCFKILDNTLRTFDEAESSCTKLNNSLATLAIIRSREEQEFLASYLFKTLKKVDNVWLGAKFFGDKFRWIDNSDISFTNFDSRGPRSKANYCVQIQADESFVGKWIDEPCTKLNLVLCQKMQPWTLVRLQQNLLDAREELANVKTALDHLKQDLIPIGFIYTQFPDQSSPNETWPSMKWEEVSSNYSGVFFRVVGDGSEDFGDIQEGNNPHLNHIEQQKSNSQYFGNYNVTNGQCSSWTCTGREVESSSYSCIQSRFCLSGGEVRPRNMAIRIWKRVG